METQDSCFDLIRYHQQCIPRCPSLEIEPVTTNGRAETLQLSQQSIIRRFKKFRSVCKNLNSQVKSVRPKTVDSEAVLQAIEKNSESIRRAQHLSVQCSPLSSRPLQKNSEIPTYASSYMAQSARAAEYTNCRGV